MPAVIRPIVFCMAVAAWPVLAGAAGNGAHPSSGQKKAAQAQNGQGANAYEQELAIINTQANAAEAACASQSGDRQLACSKQVSADRDRAMAAARERVQQAAPKR